MNANGRKKGLTLLIGILMYEFFDGYVDGKAPVQVSITEIRSMNASCGNTCSNPKYLEASDALGFQNCECGPQCTKYSTCCVDSTHRVHVSWKKIHEIPECISLDGPNSHKNSYRMVSMCHSRTRASHTVKDMCQSTTSDIRDPFTRIPARDAKTNITYRNFFCGLCNGVEPERLKLWKVTLYKIFNPDDSRKLIDNKAFADGLVFDESFDSWGVWENENGNAVFKKVFMYTSGSSSEICIPNLISDCDKKWSGHYVRKKCYAYMSPIYVKNPISQFHRRRYRNVHCAICNFVDVTKGVECQLPPTGTAEESYALSFALLMDVNTSDGIKVGKVNRCKRGQTYDPFFKKCRSLVCGFPGYTIQKGRCIKSS